MARSPRGGNVTIIGIIRDREAGNRFEFVQIYLPITFIKETFSRYDAAKMLVCSYNESLRK